MQRSVLASQLGLLAHVLSPLLRPLTLLLQIVFEFRSPLLSRSLSVLISSGQEAQDLMDLLLGQLDPRVYDVTNPGEESLSGVRGLDITDSGFLEKSRAGSREAILRDAVGT
jgi:hypothetical protein